MFQEKIPVFFLAKMLIMIELGGCTWLAGKNSPNRYTRNINQLKKSIFRR